MKRGFPSATTLRWAGLSAGLILGFLASPACAYYVADEKELELLKRTDPSADDLKEVLGSVGAEADDDKIKFLLAEVHGKDITGHADADGESSDAATW